MYGVALNEQWHIYGTTARPHHAQPHALHVLYCTPCSPHQHGQGLGYVPQHGCNGQYRWCNTGQAAVCLWRHSLTSSWMPCSTLHPSHSTPCTPCILPPSSTPGCLTCSHAWAACACYCMGRAHMCGAGCAGACSWMLHWSTWTKAWDTHSSAKEGAADGVYGVALNKQRHVYGATA